MANISEVYDITFAASSVELAVKLEKYLSAIAATKPYYETLGMPERDSAVITGEGVGGRWVYSNNIEGTFERPQQWFSEDWDKLKPTWADVSAEVAAGATIEITWSEDEDGCDIHHDGEANIGWGDGRIAIDFKFHEHDS